MNRSIQQDILIIKHYQVDIWRNRTSGNEKLKLNISAQRTNEVKEA